VVKQTELYRDPVQPATDACWSAAGRLHLDQSLPSSISAEEELHQMGGRPGATVFVVSWKSADEA
jgi:hypothetical protein